MSDEIDYTAHVQTLSTPALIRWTAGWKVGSYPRLAGEHEIQRRKDHGASLRGWIAIGLSVLSLVVSIFAILRR